MTDTQPLAPTDDEIDARGEAPMRLTVAEFSLAFAVPEALASKLLRAAALADQLTFTEDNSYLRTYEGSRETFSRIVLQGRRKVAAARAQGLPPAKKAPR